MKPSQRRFLRQPQVFHLHSAACTLAIAALLSLQLTASPTNPPPTVLTAAYINALADTLRTNHPALRAAHARTDAAVANKEGVRTWEDPMLRIGGMIADEEMRADEGDIAYGIEQKLPLFGRPKLARKVAEAELTRTQSEASFQFQNLRRDLAQRLFRTALSEHTVEIAVEDLAWLDQQLQSTEQRVRTGDTPLVDLLRLQSERRRQQESLTTARHKLEHEHFGLNRILNRNLQSPWPNLRLPHPAGPVIYSESLLDLARRYEPRLLVLRGEIQAADATSRLTQRQRLPEVIAGAQARNYTGNGNFRQAELMLGISFPWGNGHKYRRDFDRDRARVTAAEQEVADYSLSLAEDIHDLTTRIDAARREALAYRDDIIPRSVQALRAAEATWTSGRGLFLDVMDSRRMLLEARLMYTRAVAEQYDGLSDLVLCCGLGDLEALQMLGITPTPANP